MPFTQANRREVESLLSKLTTTGDAIGRFARDVRLLVRLNPQWPETLVARLTELEGLMGSLLYQLSERERGLVERLNEFAPQE